MTQQQGPGSLVRFRVVGSVSPNPQGRHFTVTPDSFTQAMQETRLSLEVKVPDRLGVEGDRVVEVSFPRPRSFRAAEVVAASADPV